MRRIVVCLMVAVFAGGLAKVAKAQQDPKFTHYMFNQIIYNPAFIGNEQKDKLCANLVQHNQWLGYQTQDESTAPLTTTFNIHSPFMIKGHKIGAGLIFINDGLGFESNTTAQLGLSYHHQFKNGNWLMGGLNLGVIQKSIDASKLEAIDPNDPLLQQLAQNGSDMVLDFGLGLLYRAENYYVGFSTLHIPQAKYDWYGATNNDGQNRVMRHYYINAGYDYRLNDVWVLQPRALIKFDRAKWQFDLGSLIEYNEKYWGGLNVRRGEGIMFLGGLTIRDTKRDQLKVGVSYDMTFSQMRKVSDGTLELMANYCFKLSLKPKVPNTQFNPRFLGGYTR